MDKHLPDTNLEFIRKKINELHTALMYSMSEELIRTPNAMVNALQVDNEGNLWFSFKAPLQYMNEYEESFPVRLNFFRKGISYHMEVRGKASIIKNQEEKQKYLMDSQALLLKMNMLYIEYAEPEIKRKSRLTLIMENLYNWFIKATAIHRSATSVLAKLQQSNPA
jgi:general stress protein 26